MASPEASSIVSEPVHDKVHGFARFQTGLARGSARKEIQSDTEWLVVPSLIGKGQGVQ